MKKIGMLTVTVILDGIWYSLHIWWLFRPAKQPGFGRWRVWSRDLIHHSREKWFEVLQGWRMMWLSFLDNCYPPFFSCPLKGTIYWKEMNHLPSIGSFRGPTCYIVSLWSRDKGLVIEESDEADSSIWEIESYHHHEARNPGGPGACHEILKAY